MKKGSQLKKKPSFVVLPNSCLKKHTVALKVTNWLPHIIHQIKWATSSNLDKGCNAFYTKGGGGEL